MSKAVINGVFQDLLGNKGKKKAWNQVMRRHFGNAYPHKWIITQDMLYKTFGFNTIYAMHTGKTQDQIFKLYGVKTAKEQSVYEGMREEGYGSDLAEMEAASQISDPKVKKGIFTTPEEQIQAQEILLDAAEKEVLKAAEATATLIYGELPQIWENLTQKRRGRLLNKGDHYIILQDEGWWDKTIAQVVNRAYDNLVKLLDGVDLDKGGKLVARDPTKKKVSDQSEEFQTFSRATQFHHQGDSAIGGGSLVKAFKALKVKEKDKLLTASERGVLDAIGSDDENDYFGPIFLEWRKQEKIGNSKQPLQEDSYRVEGTIGPRALNPSGDQDSDWKVLGPKLMRALEKVAELEGNDELKRLVDEKGSKSYAQRLQERAAGVMIAELALGIKRGGGKPRIQKNFTEDKPKNYGSSVKSRDKGPKRVKKGKPKIKAKPLKRRAKRTSQTRRTTSNNISLIALLQAKLPQTVMKNMTGARLHNQYGTFAGSVKAVTMSNMAGRPNIVYTYEEDPYQVFEMGGRGNSKWATPKRDPRYIIDLSIREIAAKMMAGKFTTTRT